MAASSIELQVGALEGDAAGVHVAPASFAQRALWLFHHMHPGAAAHALTRPLLLGGVLQHDALRHALAAVVSRHEALRTTFAEMDGVVVQVIRAIPDVALLERDLRSAHAAGVGQAAVEDAIAALVREPFDLVAGPLFRALLLRTGDAEHVLVLRAHHAVADGQSLTIVTRELGTLYSAIVCGDGAPPLAPVSPFAEQARWEHARLRDGGGVLEAELAFWRETLDGAPAATGFPTDRPHRAAPHAAVRHETLELSTEVSAGLRALARAAETTVFTVLLCALECVVARYTGQADVVVGVPVAGRRRPGVEDVVGMFVNTLPVRTWVPGDARFVDVLADTHAALRAAREHQDLPFSLLVERLRPARDPARHPYFQMQFNAPPRRHEGPPPVFAGLTAAVWFLPLEADPTLELELYLTRARESFAFQLSYNAQLFERATARRLLDDYAQLLAAVVQAPERSCSALLPAGGRRDDEIHARAAQARRIAARSSFVPFAAGEIDQPVFERFLAQANAFPERLAVATPTHAWSYGTLADHARRAAAAIAAAIAARPGVGQAVGLLLGHDAPMIAGILGALAAGSPYVPLDPAWPDARAVGVLDDVHAGVILTDRAHRVAADRIAAGRVVVTLDGPDGSVDGRRPRGPSTADAVAYVLYTSGSTGRPKGVAQSHRNLLGHIRAYTNALRIDRDDRLSLVASYTTDAAVMDVFGALLNGASLHLFDVRASASDQLGRWLGEQGITVHHSTPTLFRHLIDGREADTRYAAVRVVVLGGEVAVRDDFERFTRHFAPAAVLVNGLGPTESTLALQCLFDHTTEIAGETLPAGYPVEGTEVLLLEDGGSLVEVLGRGEIAIRSPHVALGYWRRPGLTARAFVPDPAGGGGRLYRTGDLGRRLADGRIAFLGRVDRQVKIRGHRVEPAEVEAVLSGLPTVREGAVVAMADALGEARLAAYVVPAADRHPTAAELRRALRERLPDYMLPATYMLLPALPVTGSGKVNRAALPSPTFDQPTRDVPHVAPRTTTEMRIAEVWRELLGLDRVGVHDDFFELGGHSLHAMRVVTHVRRLLGVDLPLPAVFEHPTVAELAAHVVAQQAATVEIDTLDALLAELEQLSDGAVAGLLRADVRPLQAPAGD